MVACLATGRIGRRHVMGSDRCFRLEAWAAVVVLEVVSSDLATSVSCHRPHGWPHAYDILVTAVNPSRGQKGSVTPKTCFVVVNCWTLATDETSGEQHW